MSTQVTAYTLTPAQWESLVAEIQTKYGFAITENNGTSPEKEGTTIAWAWDGVSGLVVSVDGPWPIAGIVTKDIKALVEAVTQ